MDKGDYCRKFSCYIKICDKHAPYQYSQLDALSVCRAVLLFTVSMAIDPHREGTEASNDGFVALKKSGLSLKEWW